jgi:hypothetical protein
MGTTTKVEAQTKIDEMARNKDTAFQKALLDPNSAESKLRKGYLAVLRQPDKK